MDLLNQEVKVFSGFSTNSYIQELPAHLVVGKSLKKYPSKTVGALKRVNLIGEKTYQTFYQADIIHETYFAKQSNIHPKKARVVGVYDMIQELFPALFPKNNPTLEAKRKALDRADHIISISQHTKDDLCRLFDIPSEKISVVHLAADRKLELGSNVEIDEKPYVLYVGFRSEHKNFPNFLKAFSKSEKLKREFNIISFGGEGFNRQEQDLIQSLGLNTTQVIPRKGSDMDLARLYSQAIALVYPSLYEGFGIPPLEAMGYGCPVLCSNSSSLPEVVGGAAMTFDPLNLEEMMHQMEKVAWDRECREQLIAKGYQRTGEFSWKKTAQQTLDVYRSLV